MSEYPLLRIEGARSGRAPYFRSSTAKTAPRTGLVNLRGQDVHMDLVPESAVVPAALPTSAHLAEADFSIAPAAGAVVLEDRQHDAVQVEDGEGVVEEEPHRLRAIATAPRVRFADHDADHRAPVGEVHLVQSAVANRAARGSLRS